MLKKRIKKDFSRYGGLYLLVIPVVVYYIIFHYIPMGGVLMAFEDYVPRRGIFKSDWVGLQHFITFFKSYDIWRLIRNTLRISLTNLIFGFPAPVILALLINEINNKYFKKFVQTCSYLPHFISMVILCAMVKEFVSTNGFVTQFLVDWFNIEKVSLLINKDYYVPVHVISGIWAEIGFGSIIYLAALSGIDQEQYEAAKLDGAGRIRQMLYITLPGLLPTITTRPRPMKRLFPLQDPI